jgi:hypothetical protein
MRNSTTLRLRCTGKDNMTPDMKVRVTLEWDVSRGDIKDARDFVNKQGWLWDNDPMTAVHFMNQICWPDLISKTVQK